MAEIDEHIGVAMSGLTADARTLIDHGRVETQQHRFTYNEPMPLESVTQVLAEDSAWLSLADCHAARLPPGWLHIATSDAPHSTQRAGPLFAAVATSCRACVIWRCGLARTTRGRGA